MNRYTQAQLKKVLDHPENEALLRDEPTVAEWGIQLSNTTGEPTIALNTRGMSADRRKEIHGKLGRELPVEFHEQQAGDEAIPYSL